MGSAGGTMNASQLYIWSNIVSWSNGPWGIWVLDGALASVGYNTVFATASGDNLSLYSGEDYGYNNEDDPVYLTSSNDGDPSNDDLIWTPPAPRWTVGRPTATAPITRPGKTRTHPGTTAACTAARTQPDAPVSPVRLHRPPRRDWLRAR